MHVLISWSGKQSQKVAETLREWFGEVIPGVNPWLSSEDVAAGTNWFRSLMDQLEMTSTCVICLTPENVRSPWLYFEAGAIAGKQAAARVCSYLIGVPGSELMSGPLSQFQWAEATRDGTWKLVKEINQRLEAPHNEALLQSSFDRKWHPLKRRLEKAIAEFPIPGSDAVETAPLKPVYRLSREAEDLIKEAASDKHGVVMMVRTFQGLHVQANSKQFSTLGDPREEAKWQAAVRELLHAGLVQNRGHKGESFGVTAEGYRVADDLRAGMSVE